MRKGVRVRRVVRRIELWPVAKLALLFHAVCGAITLGAFVLVWTLARRAGLLDDLAKLLGDHGFVDDAKKDVRFDGQKIFSSTWRIVAALVVIATVGTVLLAFLYNLLSGIFGGFVISFIEDPRTARHAAEAAQAADAADRARRSEGRRSQGRSDRKRSGVGSPRARRRRTAGSPGWDVVEVLPTDPELGGGSEETDQWSHESESHLWGAQSQPLADGTPENGSGLNIDPMIGTSGSPEPVDPGRVVWGASDWNDDTLAGRVAAHLPVPGAGPSVGRSVAIDGSELEGGLVPRVELDRTVVLPSGSPEATRSDRSNHH